MPVNRYKVKSWGNRVGRGATNPVHVFVAGVAKTASEQNPNAVGNELLCNTLAHAVRLPAPPGFLIDDEDGEPYFATLNFLLTGEDLPPADAAALVAAHPSLAWGIVLFDVWVVNGDRHRQNIAYDQDTGRVLIFDHSHAFLRGTDGRQVLERQEEELGISNHCLAGEICSLNGFDDWVERIEGIPEFLICETMGDIGELSDLGEEDVDWCTSYLLKRRARLHEIVMQHSEQAFPKLELDLWHQDAEQEQPAEEHEEAAPIEPEEVGDE